MCACLWIGGTFVGDARNDAEMSLRLRVKAGADQGICMPNYKFKVYNVSAEFEKLGAAVLADDNEARGFAERVIRELARSNATYATGTMEITTGKRTIACIAFESAPNAPSV